MENQFPRKPEDLDIFPSQSVTGQVVDLHHFENKSQSGLFYTFVLKSTLTTMRVNYLIRQTQLSAVLPVYVIYRMAN